MFKYELPLKNEKLPTYNLIGWILFALQVTVLIALAFLYEEKQARNVSRIGLAIIAAVSLVLYFLKKRKNPSALSVLLFLCFINWIFIGVYLAAGLAGLIFLLHNIATTKKMLGINEQFISYPRVPVDKIEWTRISTCLLKDGLFTLDLKNNKLMQHLIEDPGNVDEKEFNDFCRQQINRAH